MNDQTDPNGPESIERSMLDPAERISVSTPMPRPIDDLHETPAVPVSPVEGTPSGTSEEPTRPHGPAPLSLVFGVLLLASAVVMALHETVDFRVDWEVAGPIALIGGGIVLAFAGLIGRRRG